MISFFGTIKDGRLRLKKIEQFNKYIAQFEGKEMEVKIKRKSKSRTDQQNNLYWAYMAIIAEDTGNDPEDLHATFRAKFLIDRSGKFPIVKSTTQLSTIEFGEYIDRIASFVADYGIVLPSPDDYYQREFSKLCL